MKTKPTQQITTAPRRRASAKGSAFGRNGISGEKYPLPRLMWADCDYEDRKTPVAIYDTKSDQRGNRPDLKAVRVAVVSLDQPLGDIMTDVYNAVLADRERRKMLND